MFVKLPGTKIIKGSDELWTFMDMLEATLNMIIFCVVFFILPLICIIMLGAKIVRGF